MPTIDADAHVIETENTWNYLEGLEAEFRPVLLSANRDGREFWLIDGNVFARSNVNKAIPVASVWAMSSRPSSCRSRWTA